MKTKYLSQTLNIDESKLNSLLVIIPCYNESNNIEKTVSSLEKVGNFSFLIVDDCSTDNIKQICIKHKWNFISNDVNLGLSESFRKGIKYAVENSYDYVVQYDGDGQHNPNDLIPMLIFIEKGYDVILTSRYKSSSPYATKYHKIFAHKILRFLFLIKTRHKISDPTCGLRMFNSFVMKEYLKNKKLEVEPSTIAYLLRYKKVKIKEIGTIIYDRKYGESSFNSPKKIAKYMTRQIWKLMFLFLLKD